MRVLRLRTVKSSGTRAGRLLALTLLLSAALVAVSVRLAWLGVVRHAPLAVRAVSQRAQTVPLGPLRGRILDRSGRPLTDSRPSYRVAVYPARVNARAGAAAHLAQALGTDVRSLERLLDGLEAPVIVASGLGPEEAAEVMSLGLEGVAVVADEERYGPGSLARHVVGSVSGGSPLAPGAVGAPRGADGLEAVWDGLLRGEGPASLALFVDGRGVPIPGLGWRKLHRVGGSPWLSLPCDIITTLDGDVQAVVEEVMDRRVARGAVVVMDPWSGDVLAAASRPNFRQDRVGAYLDRTDGPLVNRVLCPYPPGSVFKPVALAAALETGAVRLDERFTCRGTAVVSGREIVCHARDRGGHGEVDLEEALALSCNVAFARIGRRVGQDGLREQALSFGFGRPTGVGLPGEAAGTLPAPAAEGPEPEAAFGQGGVTATPLQVARFYSTIANGGRSVRPRLVREAVAPTGARAVLGPRPGGGRVLSHFTAAAVTASLERAVREGTGVAAAVVSGVAGKTGTAETGRTGTDGASLYHGWFAGFWPARGARFVIVVLVEDTPVGGAEAARVFGEILARLVGGG